jgi:hypothetical protein
MARILLHFSSLSPGVAPEIHVTQQRERWDLALDYDWASSAFPMTEPPAHMEVVPIFRPTLFDFLQFLSKTRTVNTPYRNSSLHCVFGNGSRPLPVLWYRCFPTWFDLTRDMSDCFSLVVIQPIPNTYYCYAVGELGSTGKYWPLFEGFMNLPRPIFAGGECDLPLHGDAS